MIYSGTYKDRPAIYVKNGDLTAAFLPQDGGKLASLRDASREYLAQAPGERYRRLTPDGDYIASECSGFDDMFPTIDPYTPATGMCRGLEYPDHGEVCRHPLDVHCTQEDVSFRFQSGRFPILWEKRMCCEEDGIAVYYSVENHGEEDFPYIWAAHCMLQADPDGTVLTPYADDADKRVMFGNPGPMDRALPFDPAGESFKYYFREPIGQGWCGYRYGDGTTLLLRYPPEVLRYLGIWINNGSFKSMYNIALEPCSAPYDRPDCAMETGCCSVLAPGQRLTFRLLITVSHGKDGNCDGIG